MFGEVPLDIILLFMLYAGATVTDVIACIYLLLRRGNAFAPDVTPPVRLRWWTAAFFASMVLSHVWYMPTAVLTSNDDIRLSLLVGGLLDCMTVIPLAMVVFFCMLQDRRRPLWPVSVMVAPLVVGMAVGVASRSDAVMSMMMVYFLLLGIGLLIYMVCAIRQYGRWLRDNYADLEHKEVWQSFVVVALILLMFGIYVGDVGSPAYEYIVQALNIVLVCCLLWRVETLSDLSISQPLPISVEKETAATDEIEGDAEHQLSDGENHSSDGLSDAALDDIGTLLQQHCIDTQLYLQHDLTVTQLAQIIGTNRTYLGQYFSRQDTTYNAYINNLRINYFVSLYREAVAAQRPFSAKQLANDSGYRSYSTFSLAFKQRIGQSVTAWMRHAVR